MPEIWEFSKTKTPAVCRGFSFIFSEVLASVCLALLQVFATWFLLSR
jgi:hypothetical protein